MPFSNDAVVEVQQLDDKNWKLGRALRYDGTRQPFEVPPGMETDFASVPRFFVWLLPRYGRYTKAAILHDRLWRYEAREGRISLRDADGIFRRAMRESDVPFLRRWIMWTAVRWAAAKKGGLTRDWWIELPRVLLVTMLVLPIVLPPAVLILVALLAFYLLELVTWVFLKIGKLVGRRIHIESPDKQVNLPQLSFKL
jgi:hypothetical protein